MLDEKKLNKILDVSRSIYYSSERNLDTEVHVSKSGWCVLCGSKKVFFYIIKEVGIKSFLVSVRDTGLYKCISKIIKVNRKHGEMYALKRRDGVFVVDCDELVVYKVFFDEKKFNHLLENENTARNLCSNTLPQRLGVYENGSSYVISEEYCKPARWAMDNVMQQAAIKVNKMAESTLRLETDITNYTREISEDFTQSLCGNKEYNLKVEGVFGELKESLMKHEGSIYPFMPVYTSFTHGDLLKSNVRLRESNVLVIDWMHSGRRNVLFDFFMVEYQTDGNAFSVASTSYLDRLTKGFYGEGRYHANFLSYNVDEPIEDVVRAYLKLSAMECLPQMARLEGSSASIERIIRFRKRIVMLLQA